jgi:hypothetical protein
LTLLGTLVSIVSVGTLVSVVSIVSVLKKPLCKRSPRQLSGVGFLCAPFGSGEREVQGIPLITCPPDRVPRQGRLPLDLAEKDLDLKAPGSVLRTIPGLRLHPTG